MNVKFSGKVLSAAMLRSSTQRPPGHAFSLVNTVTDLENRVPRAIAAGGRPMMK